MSGDLVTADMGPSDPSALNNTVDARSLSRSQKAAVIVQMILSEGGTVDLSSLSAEAQMRLASDYTGMVRVNRATMQSIVAELETGLERRDLSFPDAKSDALAQIGSVLSPDMGPSLQERFGLAASPDPWAGLTSADSGTIAETLRHENPQIGAMILSKLPPDRAGDVLEHLSDDAAIRMTLAIANTEDTRCVSLAQVGQGLKADTVAGSDKRAFALDPIARTAAILNAAKARQRDTMLDTLAKEDPEFASHVRKAIFTFADIPLRIDPADVPKFTRDIPQDALITALVFAGDTHADVTAFILDNMSQRMADQLREEMGETPDVTEAIGEAAMGQVTAVIRALADRGDLVFKPAADPA